MKRNTKLSYEVQREMLEHRYTETLRKFSETRDRAYLSQLNAIMISWNKLDKEHYDQKKYPNWPKDPII